MISGARATGYGGARSSIGEGSPMKPVRGDGIDRFEMMTAGQVGQLISLLWVAA